MIIIGIDPGLTGAMGAVTEHGDFVAVFDLPIMRDQSLAWVDGARMQSYVMQIRESYSLSGPMRFIVERVSAMPKQGVSGVFTFGVTFGSILGALQPLGYPIEFVTPRVWKAALGLSGKAAAVTEGKRKALDRARLLFPAADLRLAKHDGRAESLLLAHWYQRNQCGRAAA